jgi:L-threonylcarbamoyladenylate synthase
MRLTLPADTPIKPASDLNALDEAAEILLAGGCVAVPTETVYGLACDASNGEAVAGVYRTKGRPDFNPLIAHVDSLERAQSLIAIPDLALELVQANWPGPLTVVARRQPASLVSDLAAAGLDTLAVRWPRSDALTRLVSAIDRPLAAPSANPSGKVSPTTAAHVKQGLNGRIHLVLDGGPCPVGVESSIVSFADPERPTLLRPGGLARQEIEVVTGPLEGPAQHASTPTSPGQLDSHYAPNARVRLNADTPHVDEAYLAFGPYRGEGAHHRFDLSASGDLGEAAARLFTGLRLLDTKAGKIAVAPIDNTGLGEAINDRLKRAAAQR